jgi:hypothetical protein
MSRKLNGSVGLDKLVHVRMKMKGKSGNEVLGTFIPDEPNHIDIAKKDDKTFINIPVVVWVNDTANNHGQHGSIKQSLSSEKYKSMEKEAAKELSNKLPYLGNLKDFSATSNETTNDAGDGQTFEEGDDLPF